jgi:hypothetical protein
MSIETAEQPAALRLVGRALAATIAEVRARGRRWLDDPHGGSTRSS